MRQFCSVLMVSFLCLTLAGCETVDMAGTRAQFENVLAGWFKSDDNTGPVPQEGLEPVYAEQAEKYLPLEPDALLTLTAIDVQKMFGKPELQRHEEPAVVWQYHSANCVLDLYFFDDSSPSASQSIVEHYEVRPRGDLRSSFNTQGMRRCLQVIAEDAVKRV